MEVLRKYGVYALLGMALTLGVTSCECDDPSYDDVEPPVVEVKNSISGMVTAMSGEAIQGATVTMDSQTTTTDSDGAFAFDNVAAGTHQLTASAEGKVSKEGSVTIAATDNMNHIWNVSLSNEGKKIAVAADGSAKGETTTETLADNTAATIEVVVEAPAGAVEDPEAEIIVTPTYSADEASATRAGENDAYLIGTNLACSKPELKLKKSITLTYNVDGEMADYVTAMKYVGGQWKAISHNVDKANNKVSVEADEFASYALYCSATISSSASTEAISFTQSTWDNQYGSSALAVDKVSYTYSLGTDISGQSNKVLAYLTEILARTTGTGVKVATGSYALNVTLPVGTAMSISGTQAVTTYTATLKDKKVSAKKYGSVSVKTKTWNRQHTGGSSR